jgi:exopolyphosphatase / guanosine-5'-triphosphate,3'-diphosphate pyrophosphatase
VKKRKGFNTETPKYRPIACVDIGSNSVRLVVYDGLRRSATPVFNEKLLCGLGKGLALTGRLGDEAIVRALGALRRFRALARQMGVKETYAVATAAAREAANGQQFIDQAEDALGASIDVLTGKEEARFAALGVIAGIPGADGIVGDLGGGSLELIDVRDGKIRDGVTLPLGALRLIDVSGGKADKAEKIVDEHFGKAEILSKLKGRSFYAVGGTWRNLARMHMQHNKYPLNVLHNYTISREQARSVADLVAHLSPSSLKDVKAVSKSRSDTLPFGALVLERLLEHSKAKNVVFSVFGVREGLLFAKLPGRKREADALLASCWDFARRYARSPEHEVELCDWTDQLFGKDGIKETDEERRLRHAACLLGDIGWRAHPDYRAERSLGMISHAAFVGVDHPGRAFLALAIFHRYDGENDGARTHDLERLLEDGALDRAKLLAGMFKLAYILSAAMAGMLPKIKLSVEGKTLLLNVPKKFSDLLGERVEKRLASLAGLMGKTGRIEIGK